MRLHRLEITAFGPFAEATAVDFDALSEAGLFLLSGPTGSGKTSILDAVTFALYGDVPGDRSGAKRLRCDTAAPGVPPRVVLEATLSGRRFRIERSPSWTRPKRRGTGETTEQARVVLSQLRDGEWHALSTRLDEAGHLITDLVGMNLSQFCQVALLPQGRFQAFLRARSEDRHALLQQVFRTGRFDQVERWLRDRRVTLRRSSLEREAIVSDIVSRLREVGGQSPPDGWRDDPESLQPWVTAAVQDSASLSAVTAQNALTTSTALLVQQERHTEVVRLAGLADRGTRAEDALAILLTRLPAVDAARDRLTAAVRADGLVPLMGLVDDTSQAVATHQTAVETATAEVAALLNHPVDQFDLVATAQAVSHALADWRRLEPTATSLAGWEEEMADAQAALDLQLTTAAHLVSRAESLPSEITAAHRTLRAAEAAVQDEQHLREVAATLERRLSAHTRALHLVRQLSDAQALHDQSRGVLLDAKETWMDLRERRLAGMAAEMAAGLAAGCSCPVCGSAEHPSPATPAHDAPDAHAERDARSRVDDLEIAHEAHAQHLRDLDSQLAVARSEAGADPEALPDAIQDCALRLCEARALASGLESSSRQLAALEAEATGVAAAQETARSRITALEARLVGLNQRVTDAHAQLSALLTPWDQPTPEALSTHLQSLQTAVRSTERAQADLAASNLAHADAAGALAHAATDAGFSSSDGARAAVLTARERAPLQDEVERHDDDMIRLRAVLDDPDVAAALATTPRPDLSLAAAALTDAEAAMTRARSDADLADLAHARLSSLSEELDVALAAWAPLRSELDLTAGLAAFVEGKSSDNRLQMRLSAYVLAHRLSQVVDAANLRLWSMSSQRYALVHTGRRGAGETRGGLSLLVRDEWSGESRDPATLSGGESFVVSLALALGLADVIGDEAGGADLHTLFVDEGFGALDAETLDDVMDVLDELRDGGRVVGVVSHVPEMQTRIPTQLRVDKQRRGSSTALHLG